MKRLRGKFSVTAKRSAAVASLVIISLFAVVLVSSLVDHLFIHPSVKSERVESNAPTKVERLIQVGVRNECGAKDIAMAFTSYLRKRGFDVVETKNGAVFDRASTTIVDAAGNYQNALRVARALGVKKENVITQLDPGSYLDVEVLIGKDYRDLKPNESVE